MTDWLSAGAMLLSGIIVGFMVWYAMKGREAKSDAELHDLEAKRDNLLLQLRELKDAGGNADERRRLERQAADVLRLIDERSGTGKPGKPAPKYEEKGVAEMTLASATRAAAIRGFSWGALSMAVLGGIGFWVVQQAKPKEGGEVTTGGAPMQSAFRQQPQSDPALQQLEAAVARSPDDLNQRNMLAKAYLERENMMGVFEQTQYVLKRAPDDPRALTYQALVRIAMGQGAGATEMLKRAINADPNMIDAYVALSWADMQSGNTSEAEALMKEAARRHPDQQARIAEVWSRMQQAVKNAPPPPANHPGLPAPGADAGSPEPGPGPALASGGGSLHVSLSLDPTAHPSPTSVLFVIVRAEGVTSGPPAAVKRIAATKFPIDVDITSADSMLGQPLPARVRIEARLDSDGDPLTKDPRDPKAALDGVATNGGKVSLVLK